MRTLKPLKKLTETFFRIQKEGNYLAYECQSRSASGREWLNRGVDKAAYFCNEFTNIAAKSMRRYTGTAGNRNEKTCNTKRLRRNTGLIRRYVNMIKVLFICHGNICRSPMAEFIMKDLVRKAGFTEQFEISSAATSTEELGNPVYPLARIKLSEHGIDCSGKTARQLKNLDYEKYDLLIGMDHANIRNMYRICGCDFADKMHLLMDYTAHPGEVADPWYTRDFDTAWRDLIDGCQGLLDYLIAKK